MAKQIENYVEENLTDGAQQTALEFIDHLRTNELGMLINVIVLYDIMNIKKEASTPLEP